MKRRTFLRNASGTAGAALVRAATPIPIAGSFAIPCPTPGFIQHLGLDSSGLYAALFDRHRLRTNLAKISFSGQPIWRADLPEGRLMSGLEVLGDGSVAALCLHRSERPEMISIGAGGEILNTRKLAFHPVDPQLVTLCDGAVLVLAKDGSLSRLGDDGRLRSGVVTFKEPFGATTAWRAGGSNLLL